MNNCIAAKPKNHRGEHPGICGSRICLVLALAWALPCNAPALGIRIIHKDAEAMARGNAFVATADNPSALYYNPAGITQLENHEVRGGAYATLPYQDFTSTTGAETHRKEKLGIDPQLFYAWSSTHLPFALGLGIYNTFGLSLEWPDDSPSRVAGREGKVIYTTFNPVVAYRIGGLSLAAGPTLNYATIEFERGVGAPHDEFRYSGDGFTPGFSVGLLWKPVARHSIGLTYRSATTVEFDGQTRFRVPFALPFPKRQSANATFDFPQIASLGYSYRPTTNWNFEVDVEWTDWEQVNALTIRQKPALTSDLDWESSFTYAFGATRYLPHGWHISAGYMFIEQSVPERTFTPLVPDMEMHVFTTGFGFKGRHLRWDVAYEFLWSPDREINNPLTASNASANGTYQFTGHGFMTSIGWRF